MVLAAIPVSAEDGAKQAMIRDSSATLLFTDEALPFKVSAEVVMLGEPFDRWLAQDGAADADDGALAMALAADNVLVTRTFSKIYGLAGERVGWATGAPELINMLNRIRGPFNLTITAQAAALAALEDQAFVEASRMHNRAERTRFAEAIAALGNHGLRPLPSEANFVLIEFSGALTAEDAYKGLMDQGFITRWLPGQGLPQCLRITIGTATEMDRVAAALRQLAAAAR